MLVGNGRSEIVAAFMVLQETDSTFSKMVDLFKKHNSSWKCVHDVTERSVFSAQISSADFISLGFVHFIHCAHNEVK